MKHETYSTGRNCGKSIVAENLILKQANKQLILLLEDVLEWGGFSSLSAVDECKKSIAQIKDQMSQIR